MDRSNINQTSELAAIERVVQLYIAGAASGDIPTLERAFYPEARMYGALAGERVDIAVSELFAISAERPLNSEGNYRATIVAVHQVEDAAAAVVEEEGCWGSVTFTDFFSLCRIDGAWTIVSKAFAHTGGVPPE